MKLDYGPLTPLISDNSISEVMVNAPDKIFVESKGVLMDTGLRFIDERALWDFIFSILLLDNKDRSKSCTFDGVLFDGSRYSIALPPMTPKFPCITLRKTQSKQLTLQDLVQRKSLTEKAAYFLSLAVQAKMNILVSGGTGSGKTVFLQALTFAIPTEERIITIEDIPELKLLQKNWVQLLSSNEDGQTISTRDCLISSLRMRPDRILIGECRKDEAFEMLQAMNTGHEGSMTTLHANSPQECLTRLENLLSTSKVDLPLRALRSQIAQSVNFVVQLKRLSSGQRIISEIMEVSGMEGDVITRAPVFALDQQGNLLPVGYVPRCIKTFKARNFSFPDGFFNPTHEIRRPA